MTSTDTDVGALVARLRTHDNKAYTTEDLLRDEAADALVALQGELREQGAMQTLLDYANRRRIELKAENEALRKALEEVNGCFEAALVEGWTDALANGDIDAIRDLYNRRIAFARTAAIDAAREGK